MSDAIEELPKVPTSILDSRIINLLLSVYGPYAFGVISLLLIWYFVAQPQLQLQAVNYEKNQQLVDQLRDTSATLQETARTLERTSVVLQQLIEHNGFGDAE